MTIFPWTKRGEFETEKERKWRIFWSYLPDWILTIFLWGIFYLLDKIDGYRRLFSVTDTSLAHPYAVHERVPVWLLAVTCGVVPAVVMILHAAVIQRSFWDAHSSVLGLILSLGLTVTFTDIIKITVGRPRPDLFGRCALPQDLTSNPIHGLTSWTACTRTDLLQDGFRSFPSGHSSFAWCGMWYFVLYLAAKMRVNNRRGYTWKSWLLLAPISCASLIAVSRTMDYRHHATDVIAGGIIGIIGAWYSYRQYYPPIASQQSWKPYGPRIARIKPHSESHQDDTDLPLHTKSIDGQAQHKANMMNMNDMNHGHGDTVGRPSTEPLRNGAAPSGISSGGGGTRGYGNSYAVQGGEHDGLSGRNNGGIGGGYEETHREDEETVSR